MCTISSISDPVCFLGMSLIANVKSTRVHTLHTSHARSGKKLYNVISKPPRLAEWNWRQKRFATIEFHVETCCINFKECLFSLKARCNCNDYRLIHDVTTSRTNKMRSYFLGLCLCYLNKSFRLNNAAFWFF